jgi:TRAP-type C4-dicarboxylate transport system substrate-binding protein
MKNTVVRAGLTRRRFIWSAAAGGLVAAAATPFRPVKAAPVQLRYVTFGNQQSFWAKFFFELQKQVKERSAGNLAIEWAGGPEVIPPFQAVDAVSKGVFDMCFTTFSYYANAVPEGVGLQTMQASPKALHDSGTFAYADEIHRKKLGVIMIGLPLSGSGYAILAKQPVKTLDDFKGRKFRSVPVYDPLFKALGVASVTVAPTEAYASLERGVVEGLGWPTVGIHEFRFHEVAKYLIQPYFYHTLGDHLINEKAFEKLPKDLQGVLLQASRATDEWGYQFCRGEQARELALMKKDGLVENPLSEGDAKKFLSLAIDSMWEKIAKDAPQTGPELRKRLAAAAAMA